MKEALSGQHRGLILRIIITWLCIFLLVGFLVASLSADDMVTMSVIPEVPKTGEPVVATFNLNNPTDEPLAIEYQLYANGRLVQSGNSTIAAQSSSE